MLDRLIDFMGKVLLFSILLFGSLAVMIGFVFFCYWVLCEVIR